MAKLSDYYPPGGIPGPDSDYYKELRIENEKHFLNLFYFLRHIKCITHETFVDLIYDEDYMSDNYN